MPTPRKPWPTPEEQAETLRALPKKRCLNCPKLFPLTKVNRRFCSQDCKNEYNRFGAAYGPLKAKLEKLIEKTIREAVAHQLRERNSELWESLTAKLAEIGFLHRSQVSTRKVDALTASLAALQRGYQEALRGTEARIEGVRLMFQTLSERVFQLEHINQEPVPATESAPLEIVKQVADAAGTALTDNLDHYKRTHQTTTMTSGSASAAKAALRLNPRRKSLR